MAGFDGRRKIEVGEAARVAASGIEFEGADVKEGPVY